MRTLKIQDPVYDAVVFDEPTSTRGILGQHPDAETLSPKSGRHPGLRSSSARHNWTGLLRAREFQRLHFLRQMGLAWLVFPSASQTRFGHSVGVYALGEMALARARVRPVGRRRAIPMWQWVHERDLDEEFLAALLLHDLGHFPFSHLLEPLYPEVCHEDLGAGIMLLDKLPPNSNLKIAYLSFINSLDLGNILETKASWQSPLICEVFKAELPKVSRFVVAWLMGSLRADHQEFIGVGKQWLEDGIKKDFDDGLHSGTLADLQVLKTLVSGLLDLDRFDHYQRDSFFSGIKISNFNFMNFVDGVTIEVPTSHEVHPIIDLTHEAAAQAVSMLEGREIISRYLFQNPTAVALQQMFHWAVKIHLANIPEDEREAKKYRWLFMTDDEILYELKHFGVRSVREIVDMITHGRTYSIIAEGIIKLTVDITNTNDFEIILQNLATSLGLSGNNDEVPKILWEPPKVIHETDPDPGRQWLDLTRVRVGGEEYSNSDRDTFDYLGKVRRANRRRLRLFNHPMYGNVKNDNFVKEAKKYIDFKFIDAES